MLKFCDENTKSVQGDSGHNTSKMLHDVYSHIIDEDRCKNAQNFERAFYSKNSDYSSKEIESDREKLIRLIEESPEIADRIMRELSTRA